MKCPFKNFLNELDDLRKKIPELGRVNAQFEALKLRTFSDLQAAKVKYNFKEGDLYLDASWFKKEILNPFIQEGKNIIKSVEQTDGLETYLDNFVNQIFPKSGGKRVIDESMFEGQLENGTLFTMLKQSVGGWDNMKTSILNDSFRSKFGIDDDAEKSYLMGIAEQQAGKYIPLRSITTDIAWYNRFWNKTKGLSKQFLVGGKGYTLGVGVFNPVGAAMLLTGQLMGRIADIGYSAITKQEHISISGLRERLGIMVIPGHSTKAFGTNSVGEVIDFLKSPKKMLAAAKDAGIEVLNTGFQEVGDLLLKNNDINKAIKSAIEEQGVYKDVDDFINHLDELKSSGDLVSYNNLIGDINVRAREKYELATGMKFDSFEGQFANTNWFKDLYFFYGKRGTRTTFNSLKQLYDFTTNPKSAFITKYHDISIEQGPDAGVKFIIETTQFNEDILQLFNRIFMGIGLGAKATRNQKDKEDDSVASRMKDAIKFGGQFTNIFQSRQSSPITRELAAFLIGVINNEQGVDDAVKDGMIRMLDQFFKDIGKRLVVSRSITGAGFAAMTQDADFWSMFYQNYMNGTSGYLKFFEDAISKRGTDFQVPKSERNFMEQMFPYLSKEREQLSQLTADQRFAKIVADPKNYLMNWLKFSIPFIKDANVGTFNADEDTLGRLVNILGDDKWYGKFLQGELEIYDKEIGINAFNILTTYAVQKKYKDNQWKDDLIKDMGKYNDDQLKENLFVGLAQQKLGKKYNDFQQLAVKSSAKGKMGLQLLMFAEADSPGSGRELLASYAQEYYQMQSQKILKNAGNKNWYKGASEIETLNPEYATSIKAGIAKDLAGLLYFVDRTSYNDISLAHIKKTYPQFGKLFTSGGSMDYALNFKNDIDTLYALDTFAKQEAYLGKPSAINIANAYAAVLTKGFNESNSPEGDKIRLKGIVKTIDEIKSSEYDTNTKNEVIQGILYGSKIYLDAGQKDPEFAKNNSKELNELYHRLFGTLKDMQDHKEYLAEKYGINTADLQNKFEDIAEKKMIDADFDKNLISKLSGIDLTDKNEFDGYGSNNKYSSNKSRSKTYGSSVYSKLTNFGKTYPDLLRTTFLYPPQNYDYRGRYNDNEYNFLKGVGYFREKLGTVYTKGLGDYNEKGDAYEKPSGRSSSVKSAKTTKLKSPEFNKYEYSRSKENQTKNQRAKISLRKNRSKG